MKPKYLYAIPALWILGSFIFSALSRSEGLAAAAGLAILLLIGVALFIVIAIYHLVYYLRNKK